MTKTDAMHRASVLRRTHKSVASSGGTVRGGGHAAATASAGPVSPHIGKFQSCATSPRATATARQGSVILLASPAAVVATARSFAGANRTLKVASRRRPGTAPRRNEPQARLPIAVSTATPSAEAQTSPSFLVKAQSDAANPARASAPARPRDRMARPQPVARNVAKGTSAYWLHPICKRAGNPRTTRAPTNPASAPASAAAPVAATATRSAVNANAIAAEP